MSKVLLSTVIATVIVLGLSLTPAFVPGYAFAQTVDTITLIAEDSITDDDTLALNGAHNIAIYESDSKRYAAVTAVDDDGLQILDITDPDDIIAKASITDDDTLALDGVQGIAIYESDNKRYAAVASFVDDGIQILDITDPDDIIAKASITDGGTLALNGAHNIAIYKSGSNIYAAVTSVVDDGLQILDITDPDDIIAKASITDDDTLALNGVQGIAIYESGSNIYAAVVSFVDDGFQILDITDPDDIIAKASITDDDTLALDSGRNIAIYEFGSKRYAAVASYDDGGLQILDITDPDDIIAKASITDDDTLALDGARGIAIYEFGSNTYAAVASAIDDGLQILDITDPDDIIAKASITDNNRRLKLNEARGIAIFESGSNTYAAVTSGTDDGVQIIRMDITTSHGEYSLDVIAPDDKFVASDQRYIHIDVGMATATGSHPSFTIFKNSGYDTYPIGETIVTWYAVDSKGNYATDTQTITVTDDRGPPKMSQPSRYSAEATGIMTPLDSTDYGVPRVYYTGELDLVAITDAPPEFPLGVTTINWTVTNSGGLSTTVSQQIYLKDTTVPTITAPPDMTFAIVDYIGTHGGSFVFSPNGGSGYIRLSDADYGLPTAYDAVGPVTISNDLSSSFFYIGENVITWVAVDGKQQVAYDTQTITIVYRLPTSAQDDNSEDSLRDDNNSEPITTQKPVPVEQTTQSSNYQRDATEDPVTDDPIEETEFTALHVQAGVPVITLTGDDPQTIELGVGYIELGATTDDGSDITIDDSAFADAVGTYLIYNSADSEGNSAV